MGGTEGRPVAILDIFSGAGPRPRGPGSRERPSLGSALLPLRPGGPRAVAARPAVPRPPSRARGGADRLLTAASPARPAAEPQVLRDHRERRGGPEAQGHCGEGPRVRHPRDERQGPPRHRGGRVSGFACSVLPSRVLVCALSRLCSSYGVARAAPPVVVGREARSVPGVMLFRTGVVDFLDAIRQPG